VRAIPSDGLSGDLKKKCEEQEKTRITTKDPADEKSRS
jgi:hypothetical protein